jgi:hypothetical protein
MQLKQPSVPHPGRLKGMLVGVLVVVDLSRSRVQLDGADFKTPISKKRH